MNLWTFNNKPVNIQIYFACNHVYGANPASYLVENQRLQQ